MTYYNLKIYMIELIIMIIIYKSYYFYKLFMTNFNHKI